MNTQEQTTINVPLEDLLQLLELSDRLVKLNYASRTEANFVKNISETILNVLQQAQNNEVDKEDKKGIPL